MKTLIIVVSLSVISYSCNNDSSSTRVKLDSIGNKLDTTFNKAWDSTKIKARELKEKIETRLEKRDSAKGDTSDRGIN